MGYIKYIIIILLFLVSIVASLTLFAKQLAGRDIVVFKQAMEAVDKKNWVLAESLLTGLYNQFPDNSVISNNLAVACFNQGELEKAQKIFSSIIEQNKLTATAYQNLKKLYSYSAAKTYSTGLNLLKPIELPQLLLLNEDIFLDQNLEYPETENLVATNDKKLDSLSKIVEQSSVVDANPPIVKQEPVQVKKEQTAVSAKPKEIPDMNWFAQQNQLNKLPIKTRKEHTKAKLKVENELLTRLEQWRNAWSSGNSDEYISMYKRDYSPAWEKRNKWVKDRKLEINKNYKIQVEIEKPRIFIHKLTFQPFILFKEKVSSEKYTNLLLKHLYWIKEGGEWVIEKETTIKKM